MKLRTRIAAVTSAVALAIVGWAVPAANATETQGGTRTAAFYEQQYEAKYPDRAYFCMKFNPGEGSPYGTLADDGKAITLKEFPSGIDGDQWGLLVVKGGAEDGGDATYELPNANQAYSPPANGGGKTPEVSHWIVCGMSAGWKYPVTCEKVVVDYPEGMAGIEINVRFRNLATDATTTLTYKPGGTLPDPATFRYADHARWPGWTYYKVEWVQVDGNNYHWSKGVTCGQPEPVVLDYCEWGATDGAVHHTLREDEAVPEGWVLWDGYSAQAQPPAGCEPPPEDLCSNLDGAQSSQWLADGPWSVRKDGTCAYTTYVCWEMPGDGMHMDNATYRVVTPGAVKQPRIDSAAFPQALADQGGSFDELAADACGQVTPVCNETVWLQLDKYTVRSMSGHEALEELLESGSLTWDGGPADASIYQDHRFVTMTGGACAPPTIDPGITPLCMDGAPVFQWTVTLTDEDNQLASPATQVTLTFSDPDDPTHTWERTYPLEGDGPTWTGSDLWPGYSEDGEGNPLTWPGWTEDASGWVFDGVSNEGWAREAMNVHVAINPQADLAGVAYPDEEADCLAPEVVEVCQQGQHGWAAATILASEYDGAAPGTYREWTGDAKDCLDFSGDVQLCHAESDGSYTAVTAQWSAAWDGNAWVVTIADGHAGDEGDIINAINAWRDGVHVSYPGQNLDNGGWGRLHHNGCEDTVGVCVMKPGDQHYTTMWVRESIADSTYADNPRPAHHSCAKVRDSVDLCHALGEGDYEQATLAWTVVGSTLTNFDPTAFESEGHGSHEGDVIPAFTILDADGQVVYDYGGQHLDLSTLIDDFGCEPIAGVASVTSSSSEMCEAPGGTYDFSVTVSSAHRGVAFRLERSNGDGTWEDLGALGDVARGADGSFTGTVPRAGEYRIVGAELPPVMMLAAAVEEGPALAEILPSYTAFFTVADPEGCADIDGTVLGGICEDGVPFLSYTVRLNDPYGEVTIPEVATLTFGNETAADAGMDYVYEVPLQTPAGGGTYENVNGTVPFTTITYAYADGVHTWTGHALWPGGAVDEAGAPTGWPGWELLPDGTWQSVGDENYGWTRAEAGVEIVIAVNPQATTTAEYPMANPDCDGPPPVEVCQATDDGWVAAEISAADYDANRDSFILWDEEAANHGCPTPTEPTLAGSLINSVCVADSPWVRYSLHLTDPDDVADYDRDDPNPVTLTWVHPGDDRSLDYVLHVPLGDGYALWPGAVVEPAEGYTEDDIDPTNPDTFVPTDWPGWATDENGEWFQYDDPEIDYGWTRAGVTVTAEVNPSFDVTLAYPPPTPTCAAAPPTITTVVADAPPPTAVEVPDITYTG